MHSRREFDPLFDGPLPDAREMCFAQGKVFVHMNEGDHEHIWAEWPDGTIDRHNIEKGTVRRELPNGQVTEVPPDDLALGATADLVDSAKELAFG